MESKGGKNSSIIFCTNGILLRVLVSRGADISNADATSKPLKDGLKEITHIVVVCIMMSCYLKLASFACICLNLRLTRQ